MKEVPAKKRVKRADASVDLDGLAAQYRGLRGGAWWKMEEGRVKIRPIPFVHEGTGRLFAVEKRHFGLHPDHNLLPCLAMDRDSTDCPFCSMKDVSENKDLQKAARPSTKYPMLIIDRTGADMTIQRWRAPFHVVSAISEIVLDTKNYPDAVSLEKGFDFIVSKTGSGFSTRYSCNVAPGKSKVTPKGSIVDLIQRAEQQVKSMLEEIDLDGLVAEIEAHWS